MYQPGVAGGAGTIAGVIGSVTSAVALIGLHKLKGIDPNAIVVHFSAVSVVTLICLIVIQPLSPQSVALLVGGTTLPMLLLGTGLAAGTGQLLLTRAFATGAPARVSIVSLTQVVFAMGFDQLIWGRHFSVQSLFGMVLVLAPTGWMILQRSGRR